MFVCKNCKGIIKDDMIFCQQCGAKYLKKGNKVYSMADCPVDLVEHYVWIADEQVWVNFTFQSASDKTIDACSVLVKGTDQFGDPVSDTKMVYSDLNADMGEVFGNNKIFTVNDYNMRKIYVVVEKVVYDDGSLWVNDTLKKLEESEKDYIKSIEDKNREAFDALYNMITNPNYTSEEYLELRKEVMAGFDIFNIPSEIESIPESMFDSLEKDVIINISDNVKEIGARAFFGAHVKKIPEGLSSVGESAFESATIEHFDLCSPIITEGNWVFRNANIVNGCTEVRIPENSRIVFNSFTEIRGLKKIIISSSAKLLGTDNSEFKGFHFDSDLEEIEVEEKNGLYKSIDGVLYDKYGKKLLHYPARNKNELYVVPYSLEEFSLLEIQYAKYLKYLDDTERAPLSYDVKYKVKGYDEYGLPIVGRDPFDPNTFVHIYDWNRLLITKPSECQNLRAVKVSEPNCFYVLGADNINLMGREDEWKKYKQEIDKGLKKRVVVYAMDSDSKPYKFYVNDSKDYLNYIIMDKPIEEIIKDDKEKEKQERIEVYWLEHQEEKKSLLNQKKSLQSEIDEIQKEIEKKQEEINQIENKKVESEEKVEELTSLIEKLNQELSGLGLFKGKRKKEIDLEIADLVVQVDQNKLLIENEKKTYKESIVNDVKRIKSEIDELKIKKEEVSTKIDEIDSELNMERD